MDEEMDYERETYVIKTDNRLGVSNIQILNQSIVENETLRAVKFFQLLNLSDFNKNEIQNDEELKKQKKKQNIINKLQSSKEKLDNLITFLRFTTLEKPFYKLKSHLIHTEICSKETKKINYLKKVDCFNKASNNFHSSLKVMSENNKISQIIFRELTALKEIGFQVEENFKFPEVKEIISIKLTHKLIKIYDCLCLCSSYYLDDSAFKNKFHEKFNFDLKYNTRTGTFELTSNFYENFNKKNKLIFDLEIKCKQENGVGEKERERLFYLNNNRTSSTTKEDFLEEFILDNLKSNNTLLNNPLSEKYNIKSYLIFYVKYFLYFIFKYEIRNIIKISGNNFFNYRNFHFRLEDNVKEFTIIMNNFNFLEILIKMAKIEKDLSSNRNGDLAYSNSDNLLIDRSNSSTNKQIIYLFSLYVKAMIKNFIYDIRMFKIINELSRINNNTESAFNDFIDYSIFIKNLSKISNLMLRKCAVNCISNIVDNNSKYYSVKYNILNFYNQTFSYKFIMFKNSINNSNSISKVELTINFNRNMVSYEIKTPIKNIIFICEREIITEIVYKGIDMNYLLLVIENLIKNNQISIL